MEPIQSMEAFSYGDGWDPISLLFTNEDLELTQRLLGHGHPPGLDIPIDPEVFLEEHMAMPGMYDVFMNPGELTPGCDSLMGSSSQEGSYASGFDGYYCPGVSFSMEKCTRESFVPDFTGILGVDSLGDQSNAKAVCDRVDKEADEKMLQPKRRRLKASPCTAENEDDDADMPENLTKRKPRASKSDKGKKTAQPKKKQKLAKPNEYEADEGNVNASPSCSEEGSTSHDLNNGYLANEASVLNSDGKTTTRASRGTATDPQSLYARRRRERINERLKILQNLVPNGTKVDISTMLEEAVHYVKFLQLQIKLLSSDELWMYAPIAYNGMDIGLNQMLPRHHHLLS